MKRRIAKKILNRFGTRGAPLPGHYRIKELRRYEARTWKDLDSKLTIPWFIYDKKTGKAVKVTCGEWHWWGWLCGNRFIKRTEIQRDEFVSTICLGIDHDFMFGLSQDPVIFETMWFKDNMAGEDQKRARTLDEALKHHQEMVDAAKQVGLEIDALFQQGVQPSH